MIDGEPHPLKPDTLSFLSTYRQSNEFGFQYNGNLSLTTRLESLSEIGVRQALWSRAFVDRVFAVNTVEDVDRLLKPWDRWGNMHSRLWSDYYHPADNNYKDYHGRYDVVKAKFNQVEIPPEIREYQGDLLDDELRSLAHWNIFRLTKDISGAIDLIEGDSEPASLDTIFLVQRTLNKAVHPVGGLESDISTKPTVRKVDQDGRTYIAFDIGGELADFATEDPSSEQEWQRWNTLQLGAQIRYLTTNRETRTSTVENGVVQGFYLLGAGDAMLFGPSVANIGIVAVNNATGFYQCPLVSQIRLEAEPIIAEDLEPKPEEPVDVVMMGAELGVVEKTYDSMESATKAVVRVMEEFLPPTQQT